MSLQSLPTEILEHVAKYITSIHTLNALSRVNRRLHDIFVPLLYRQDACCAPPSIAVCWAAKHGMMCTLQKCLEHGAKIHTHVPAPHACQYRERGYLYGNKIKWEYRPPRPIHPLSLAVEGAHLEMVEFLLDGGCDVNTIDPEGFSLLSLAVIRGDMELAELLLRRGAGQVEVPLMVGTPIQIASFLNNGSMLELLWKYGSEGLQNCRELKDALECAMEMRHTEIIHLLVSYGVRVETMFSEREWITPLEWATEMEDVDLVELFLSVGASPRYSRCGTKCALERAVLSRNERIASLLVLGSSCLQRTLALAYSAEQADGCFARFLLAHGTHPYFDYLDYHAAQPVIYLQRDCMIPPLVRAVNAGHGYLVRLLVEHGADVNACYEGFVESRSSRRSGSVLRLAMDLGDQEIVSFLLEHGAEEEVTPYEFRVLKMSMEEDNSREGQQKKRKRLRRHMGLTKCLSSTQRPAIEPH
ncbi:ankyrin repeat-containing domain protein [Aspergillus cavernicola]|uniref:Ankyrin repeat-containing domain protein n=1 Tax=Aspergillus cavernicola TaxID=176166 RepID=A0ABR4I3B6_9EURO